MTSSNARPDDVDTSRAPGHAGDVEEPLDADPEQHYDGDETGDNALGNPHVETDHLYDLMPDEDGKAEGRPIPTGV